MTCNGLYLSINVVHYSVHMYTVCICLTCFFFFLFFFYRGTKNRSLYVKFWRQEALCKGEVFFLRFATLWLLSVAIYRAWQDELSPQDMQVLSKVEASLELNQVPLRPEAKNFTEVAALACRGEYSFQFRSFLHNNCIWPKYFGIFYQQQLCFCQVHCQAMEGNA